MNASPQLDPRAFDLSTLSPQAAPAGASFVTDADDRTFESLLARSMQYPLVVEFWSPRAHAEQFSADLAAHANAAAGRYLLVRVNVDEARAVATALGVQAVPFVVGVLGGQLAPLFQGTADSATIAQALDQLLTVATANGIVGRAQPVAGAVSDAPADDPSVPDPRFAAADAALADGDYATAEAEFAKLVAANPADTEAAAGIAQTRLLARLSVAAPDAGVSDPNDVEAQLAAADLDVASGNLAGGFGRLVELVRHTSGDTREQVRQRLLELFQAVGASQPEVLTARRDLMAALF